MMRVVALGCIFAVFASLAPLHGSDHGDTPVLAMLGRTDAQITDVFAFVRGENLVLTLCTNPAIPQSVSSYQYAPDFTATFYLDHHSQVSRANPFDLIQYGGTILQPNGVVENVSFRVTFDELGAPVLHSTGIAAKYRDVVQVFAGLRDDPFIRKPRTGRNVAAIVIELPLEAVLGPRTDLLIWATTSVPEFDGPIADHGGRALRSMFDEPLNSTTPGEHWRVHTRVPDVMILDVTQISCYPNGRELADDVIDLVVDIPGGTLPGEGPEYPAANDVPFLAEFPYLAVPHPAM